MTSILFRVNRLRISLMQRVGHGYAQRNTPLLLNAYEALGRLGGSGARNQPYKGYHLWKSLLKFKPKKITEMGSGTTSAVFALYARQYEASYEAFEHSEHWGEKTVTALHESHLADDVGPIKIVDSYVAPDGSGSAFAEPIHHDTDFLYIDGPPCPIIEGVKKPNLDVIQLFERGRFPETILVDGRHETVDLIQTHPAGERYHFYFEFGYSVKNRRWAHAIHFHRHTILRLKKKGPVPKRASERAGAINSMPGPKK